MDWLSPEEWRAVALSLRVAFWATLASLPLGVLTAYALARWRFPGRQLLNGAVHLPLILPPVATGYLLLLTFGTQGPLGGLLQEVGIVFAFRWTGAALAAAVMAFPLMVPRHPAFHRGGGPEAGAGERDARRLRPVGLRDRDPAARPARNFSPARSWRSPRRWESSERRSPSSPTFPARRRRCRRPSTLSSRCPGGEARAPPRGNRRCGVHGGAAAFRARRGGAWQEGWPAHDAFRRHPPRLPRPSSWMFRSRRRRASPCSSAAPAPARRPPSTPSQAC